MKLTKNNLIKKLGESNSDVIEVVTKYNKLLPILSEDGEGFCVNARDLHEQLKIGRDFSTWIKGSLESLDMKLHEDFDVFFKGDVNLSIEEIEKMSSQQRTMTCAKELCMAIGILPKTNKETKEISKIARKYFIYVERLLKKAIEWDLIRKPERIR